MKIFKKPIFTFVLGFIIFGSLAGVSATILQQSSDIGFTPTNSSWNVRNVEDAINYLHDNGRTNGVSSEGEEHISLEDNNTYNLPSVPSYTWVSEDTNKITIDNNGTATINNSGNVYLMKDNNRYFKYSFEYHGPAIRLLEGAFATGSTSNNLTTAYTLLTDGIKTKQGQYDALSMGNASNRYLKFTVSTPIDITFSSGNYSDSAGSSGKTAKFFKLNSNNEEELYTSFETLNNTEDYQTKHFDVGTYVLRASAYYISFSEWTIVETE